MINMTVLDTDRLYGKCVEKTIEKLKSRDLQYIGQVFSLKELHEMLERESLDILIISSYFYERMPAEISSSLRNAYILVTTLDINYSRRMKSIHDNCRILSKPFDVNPFLKLMQDILKEIEESSPDVSETSTEKLEYIKEYIRTHLNEELSVAKLAELIYYSPSYLSKVFKKYTGSSVSDYIRDLRVKRAELLLETTDYQVQEIAEMVGIPKINTFGTAFRSATGMSPSVYRSRKLMEKQEH